MSTTVSNSSEQILSATNNIFQASNETCSGKCTQNNDNISVIISGSRISGGINFSQSCDVDVSCAMNSTLDSNVQSILNAMADQTASAQLGMFNASLANINNNAYIAENITNQITQVMNSTCQADLSQTNQNISVVLVNDTLSGGVNYTQKGNVQANCVMTNTARSIVLNQETAETKQKAKRESVLAMIVVAIVICILFGGAMLLIFLFHNPKKGDAKDGKKKKSKNAKKLKEAELFA